MLYMCMWLMFVDAALSLDNYLQDAQAGTLASLASVEKYRDTFNTIVMNSTEKANTATTLRSHQKQHLLKKDDDTDENTTNMLIDSGGDDDDECALIVKSLFMSPSKTNSAVNTSSISKRISTRYDSSLLLKFRLKTCTLL